MRKRSLRADDDPDQRGRGPGSPPWRRARSPGSPCRAPRARGRRPATGTRRRSGRAQAGDVPGRTEHDADHEHTRARSVSTSWSGLRMPNETAFLIAFVAATNVVLIQPTMSLTGSRKSTKNVSGNAVGSARVRAYRSAITTAPTAIAATIRRWRRGLAGAPEASGRSTRRRGRSGGPGRWPGSRSRARPGMRLRH